MIIKMGDSEQSYLETLLAALPSQDNIRIKREMFELLKSKIYSFSGGNSSVSKERGQVLMDANVYLISLYLKQFSRNITIKLLLEKKIDFLYQQGLVLMKRILHSLQIEVEKFREKALKYIRIC